RLSRARKARRKRRALLDSRQRPNREELRGLQLCCARSEPKPECCCRSPACGGVSARRQHEANSDQERADHTPAWSAGNQLRRLYARDIPGAVQLQDLYGQNCRAIHHLQRQEFAFNATEEGNSIKIRSTNPNVATRK